MDAKTKIRNIFLEGNIYVPDYQRAYSWGDEQIRQFIKDVEDYVASSATVPYYFGHFLFEKGKEENSFAVIDGQQRLTTIAIFVCAVFDYLKKQDNSLSDKYNRLYSDIVKNYDLYRFDTVKYDNDFFRGYVIDKNITKCEKLDTQSKKHIADAYKYFSSVLDKKSKSQAENLLDVVVNASCTTYLVTTPTEGAQMFIFQNDRGKKPTTLEVIKAQFMYHIYLSNDKDNLQKDINEITCRFENIYKAIAKLEGKSDEDDVLIYAQCVYFNSLYEYEPKEKILKTLDKEGISFIKNFTQNLEQAFDAIVDFYENEKTNMTIHTLDTVATKKRILMPFIVKAIINKISDSDFDSLSKSFASIFLRDKIVATRADLTSRLNDVFQEFDGNVSPIIERIDWIKQQENYPWFYWNDKNFTDALNGVDGDKVLLWLYENHLAKEQSQKIKRFENITKGAQIEHIAPREENPMQDNGYFPYNQDDEDSDWQRYVYRLGNSLLLSSGANSRIGNDVFLNKREAYTENLQQKEVCDMTQVDLNWTKEKIDERHKKIVDFLINEY